MGLFKFSKIKGYLFSAISGLVLMALATLSFILAWKENDDFEIFIRGISLFIWTIFTISYTLLYRKEKRLFLNR